MTTFTPAQQNYLAAIDRAPTEDHPVALFILEAAVGITLRPECMISEALGVAIRTTWTRRFDGGAGLSREDEATAHAFILRVERVARDYIARAIKTVPTTPHARLALLRDASALFERFGMATNAA